MFESNKDRMQIRSRNQPWFNWRKTKRWQDLCAAIFKRDSFTCQCGCGQQAVKADLVCGHVAWHAGNEAITSSSNARSAGTARRLASTDPRGGGGRKFGKLVSPGPAGVSRADFFFLRA
jgi:hypothetical protein